MRRKWLAVLAVSALPALGQAPAGNPAADREACADRLVLGVESYDLGAGGNGYGAAVDGLRCVNAAWTAIAGASSFEVAGSRWSVARVGATLRRPEGHVAWIGGTGGAGRNAGGRFGYRKLTAGVSVKLTDRVHAKLEPEYFDIDVNRGSVGKAGIVALLTDALALDLTLVRSIGGNLPARAATARLDAVFPRLRFFGGVAHGRLLPQVQDIAGGARAPDRVSRGAFLGAGVKTELGEIIAAVDTTRDGGTRRTTYAVGFQVPLP